MFQTKTKTIAMSYQNISAVLAAADLTSILTKINEIKALLPFLVNLTPDDIRGLSKISDKSESFVAKALGYAETVPQLVPPYLNVPEFRKDYNLYLQLKSLLQQLEQLSEGVRDTTIAVGSEANAGALTFYKSAQVAAKLNVPGADSVVDDLAQRFEGQGNSGEPTPPPPNP